MPRIVLLPAAALLPLLLGGCLAKTALDVVTAPVRVASKAADLATTSQAEADQSRGREIRRREQRLGQLQQDYGRAAQNCAEGSERACRQAEEIQREYYALMPGVPVEPGN